MNDKPLLPVKSDFVFKLIFGDQRNVDILGGFLQAVLDIPADEYEQLTIVDPHVKKESDDDKFGILDVKVHTKSGKIVHVEVQLLEIPEMRERCVYYQAKLITEQLSSGQPYTEIKRVISIIITDFVLVPENVEYHNQFRFRSDKDGADFTDITEINVLELPKLPSKAENSDLWYWTKLIKSDNDKEALDMIAERNQQMKKAVGVLMELSADQRARMLFDEREKARRDVASMTDGARRDGIKEGSNARANAMARKMLLRNRPIDEIMDYTELSREAIEQLRAN
jgi:predicted transposase/invertase (TIGR01784 family)